MTKNLFTNIMLVGVCFFLQGCYVFQDSRQKDWHHKIMRASSEVTRVADKRAPFITDKQLVALIGEPDLKVRPLELEKLLVWDDSYRKRIMKEVWSDYCQDKRNQSSFQRAPEHDDWKDCEEFKKCSLWLYDESRHFNRPMVWGWGTSAGFMCDFFFVEGHNVIGATLVGFWRPLRPLPSQPMHHRKD